VIVRRRFTFEAAHELPNHPGKCRRLHGHSYALVVSVEGPVEEESGMVIDFSELKKVVHDLILERLDHRYVNDLIENPTAERMAVWIWDTLVRELDGLLEIELHETERCSVVYRGNS
jgi:6-pyruvoyltetrahydropterin/6-carboxytetrahydropterin synthase